MVVHGAVHLEKWDSEAGANGHANSDEKKPEFSRTTQLQVARPAPLWGPDRQDHLSGAGSCSLLQYPFTSNRIAGG